MSIPLDKDPPSGATNPAVAGSEPSQMYAAIVGYPFVVFLVALALSLFALPAIPTASWPENATHMAFASATVLLVINHVWILTETELARLRHGIYVVPEEIPADKRDSYAPSAEGHAEVTRCHNIHRNTTENALYFFPLAIALLMVTPPVAESAVWCITFAIARLGYTFSYLRANTALRSICMTLNLLAMFGLAIQLGRVLLV